MVESFYMQGERGREAVIHGGVAMVLASMEDDRCGQRETCGGDEVLTLVKANKKMSHG